MTKTKKPTLHRVPIYRRPIFLIAVALAAIVAILLLTQSKNNTPPGSSTSSSSQSQNQPSSDDKPSEDDITTEKPDEPEKVTQFEGGDPNDLAELTGHVAYHGVTGNTLTITASIDQFLDEAGNCELQLSQNGKVVYSGSLSAKADVTTSVCGPFEIPTYDLSGTYQIKIVVNASNKTGTITGETTI